MLKITEHALNVEKETDSFRKRQRYSWEKERYTVRKRREMQSGEGKIHTSEKERAQLRDEERRRREWGGGHI